jgi:hypothetical protein
MAAQYITIRLTVRQAEALVAAAHERLSGGEGEHEAVWGENYAEAAEAAQAGIRRIEKALESATPKRL